MPLRRTAFIVAVAGLIGVTVLGATLLFLHTSYFQRAVIAHAAARLGRHVEVSGPLRLNLLSATPSLTAAGVTLSNPSWMPAGTTAQIGKLVVVFDFPWPGRASSIRRLEMLSATLHLVRDSDGRANWQWRPPGTPKTGDGFLLRSLYMPAAHVVLDDARRHLQFTGTVTAGDVAGPAPPAPLRIEGDGQLNGRPASFEIDGEPLATASHEQPYAFTFTERSGDSQLRGHGRLLRPFDPGVLDADFAANGASMSDLYFLAGLHFPSSAPFTLTGSIQRRGRHTRFDDLVAHFGRSDLRGTVALEIVNGRPRFNADLLSRSLRLYDFGRHQPDGSPLPSTSPASLLLPDVKVPLQGLRGRDALVRFRADNVESHAVSVSAFSGRATISGGILNATDLHGRYRGSRLSGSAAIDVRGNVPQTALDLTISDLPLAQFARRENTRPPLEGRLHARLKISGHGDSLHEVASSANGDLSVSMSSGAMRASMAEMTAATLRGLGLTLTKSDAETPVRCGIASFRARDGVLSTERLVIETDPVVITGAGDIRLANESLDLVLRGEPRKTRIFRLHEPVSLTGSLKHPSFHLGAAQSLADAGNARAPLACDLALADASPGSLK